MTDVRQVIKSTRAESQENAQQALAVKDLPELLALQTRVVQPIAEKLGAYRRHLYDIASATQAEFAKVTETQVAEQNRRVQTFVDTAAQNAPVGSEAAITAMKSALLSRTRSTDTSRRLTGDAGQASRSSCRPAMSDNRSVLCSDRFVYKYTDHPVAAQDLVRGPGRTS